MIARILIMWLLLAACGSSKSSFTQKSDTIENFEKSKVEQSDSKEEIKTSQENKIIEVTQTEIIRYDTNVSDSSGRYPVKEIIKSVTTKGDFSKIDTDVVRKETNVVQDIETSSKNERIEVMQKEEIKETSFFRQWKWIIWGILILIILFILNKKNIFAGILNN